ncbi:MAG TPA: nickel-dependent lactate racemase [Aggregatilinea sp.]|uniref:nickel-dependent lactate racemase n=1 Tax=Aggregatilinea sp. TaxID=2806333 RepID=UPI002CA84554|nr:nickel-dependent lactate racemase [Aggregatilinea sp.]HML21904.1 nickel-dependent lactate racemase [Aggregatilinea sp.]
MQIKLAYGKQGLPLSLPDDANVTVLEPAFVPGLPDEAAALREALRAPLNGAPLHERVGAGDTVAIVFSDITRPTPNHLLIPALLAELDHVPPEQIVLVNALGTHRPNTDDELRRMLGDAVVDRCRIEQSDAFDASTQVHLGTTSFGHELWVNRAYMDADVKILTGFIEPHFFAGFSGGGKSVMPGIAGQATVLGNHDAGMIGSPNATWGVTWGNPIWEEARECALRTEPDFVLNVTLNRDKHITGIFAGDLDTAHQAGIDFVRRTAMVPIREPFDVVITTNSGYPLDLNLYQAVKGMSAAAQAVRQGGAIVIASECWDGIPDHGLYGQLLHDATSPDHLLANILSWETPRQDQWQAQIQAKVQQKARVFVYSDYLSDEQLRGALLEPCRDIAATVEALRAEYGRDARIAVMPEGPQTVPYRVPEAASAG